jgi:hypothetical protein
MLTAMPLQPKSNPAPIVLNELAVALKQKPFRIVADVMKLGQFKHPGDLVDYDIAAKVAQKYGFYAKPAGASFQPAIAI